MRQLRRPILVLLLLLLGVGLVLRFWPHHPLPPGTKADLIQVDKAARRLSLLKGGQVIASYQVALGRHPQGHKVQEHDGRTPEGRYFIRYHKHDSDFHRALKISYPNAADVQRARQIGRPAGDYIMVHGIRNDLGWLGRLHRLVDWTDGCIAVTDEEIEDISRAVDDGTPIEIRP